MITPADFAKMIATSAVYHAQNRQKMASLQDSRSLLAAHLHESQSVQTGQQLADQQSNQRQTEQHKRGKQVSNVPINGSHNSTIQYDRQSNIPRSQRRDDDPESTQHDQSQVHQLSSIPTPAIMPSHRTWNMPTTFTSLTTREFPVVREYSAGGIIFDNQGRVAVIARHSRSGHLEWCLPKGHIEDGESPSETAVREIHEETGILGEVVDSIATVDYWFIGVEQRIHKLVHHFALRYISGTLSIEYDPDHEAEQVAWVEYHKLDQVLTYANERKIVGLYARKIERAIRRSQQDQPVAAPHKRVHDIPRTHVTRSGQVVSARYITQHYETNDGE